MNVEAPWIVNENWSKEEERRLRHLAVVNRGHNWHEIAGQLHQEIPDSRRTPTQCFAKYQRSLNPNLTKSKWSEEEDRILYEAVKLYGLKNWGQVANCLDGRTGQQCLHRYQKTLSPDIKKGKWEWEEDRRLQLATAIYGPGKWSYICAHVPKRTDVQCRERWCNLLAPEISHQA
jgi:myb proto-oncogene protein